MVDWQSETIQRLKSGIKSAPLPSSRAEAWKYTQIEKILENLEGTNETGFNQADLTRNLPDEVLSKDSAVTFVDGSLFSEKKHLPEGVSFSGENTKVFLEDFISEDAMSVLARTNLSNIAVLNVTKSTEGPLSISTILNSGSQQLNSSEVWVFVESGVELTLHEDLYAFCDEEGFLNHRTNIYLEKGAKVKHSQTLRGNPRAFVRSHVQVKMQEDSGYDFFNLVLGGRLSRTEQDVDILGERANCRIQGLYLVSEKHCVDLRPRVNHFVGNSQSEQLVKGIAVGQGKAIFNGRIFIAQDAQKVDSSMLNKNLLLSESAEIYTKPELDVYADDVKAGHGATVGQLNEEELFYLKSRCIDELLAKKMLIEGFAKEPLQRFAEKGHINSLTSFLERLLPQFVP